jgi:hypothetical protein
MKLEYLFGMKKIAEEEEVLLVNENLMVDISKIIPN